MCSSQLACVLDSERRIFVVLLEVDQESRFRKVADLLRLQICEPPNVDAGDAEHKQSVEKLTLFAELGFESLGIERRQVERRSEEAGTEAQWADLAKLVLAAWDNFLMIDDVCQVNSREARTQLRYSIWRNEKCRKLAIDIKKGLEVSERDRKKFQL